MLEYFIILFPVTLFYYTNKGVNQPEAVNMVVLERDGHPTVGLCCQHVEVLCLIIFNCGICCVNNALPSSRSVWATVIVSL